MKVVSTEKAPAAIGPYSQGIVTGGLVFVSGQTPIDPQTGKFEEDITAQAEQSCRNVGEILKAAGSGFEKVVKTTCRHSGFQGIQRSLCEVFCFEAGTQLCSCEGPPAWCRVRDRGRRRSLIK